MNKLIIFTTKTKIKGGFDMVQLDLARVKVVIIKAMKRTLSKAGRLVALRGPNGEIEIPLTTHLDLLQEIDQDE